MDAMPDHQIGPSLLDRRKFLRLFGRASIGTGLLGMGAMLALRKGENCCPAACASCRFQHEGCRLQSMLDTNHAISDCEYSTQHPTPDTLTKE